MIRSKINKIGIYSPYLSTMGGGEKYLLEIASCLSDAFKVEVQATEKFKKEAGRFFNLDLSRVDFVIRSGKLRTKDYDCFLFMTDGSLFFSLAPLNFLIIQSPLHIPDTSFFNRLKLRRYKLICYSDFMRNIILKKTGIEAKILSPFIDIQTFKPQGPKKNLILSVGRIFPYPHNKRHDMLIRAFKTGYEKYFRGYKLVIAGGLTEKGGRKIYQKMVKDIRGYPIEIKTNLAFTDLLKLYRQAKFYWHAAGAGSNPDANPEKAEHFGMSTLEAMACGGIPVVFQAGGQEDIIQAGKNGLFWKNETELVSQTVKIIKNHRTNNSLSGEAIVRARNYSRENFQKKLYDLIFER